MSINLTKKQKALLDYISGFIEENGTSPSYREIAAGIGLKSVASVAEHVDNLVALGALRRVEIDTASGGKKTKALEVVDTSYPETTALFLARLNTCTEEESIILQQAANILHLDLAPSTDEIVDEEYEG
ncbi:MAG: hypothetical protein Q4E47_03260 [Candidatus Saccharibacteria bacterium]|nr:hypothetical protein [Candidatus Saccharibacteria bacterium]